MQTNDLGHRADEVRNITVLNIRREIGESLRRLGVPHELSYIMAEARPAGADGRVRRVAPFKFSEVPNPKLDGIGKLSCGAKLMFKMCLGLEL